jgi:MATE family multidrug resistance protein
MKIEFKYYQKIFKIALPLMIAGVSMTLLTFIDRIFYAYYNADAFAACIPAGILSFTFIYFFNSILSFSGVFIGFQSGANSNIELSHYFRSALLLSIVFGLCLIILIPAGKEILEFFPATDEVKRLERIYFSTLLYGAVFSNIIAVFIAFFTGISHTKIVFYVTLFSNLINVCLDYGLIYGKFSFQELGMFGGALATVFSNILSCIFYGAYILFKKDRLGLYLEFMPLKWMYIKNILQKGAVKGVYNIIDLVGWVFLLNMMTALPEHQIFANNIVFTIERFCYMPIVGLAAGCTVLISTAHGAQSPLSEIKKVVWHTVILSIVYSLLFALFFNLFPNIIELVFTHQPIGKNKQGIIDAILIITKILPLFLLLNSFTLICISVIEAFQEIMFKFSVSLVSTFLLFIPGTYILMHRYLASIFIVWIFIIMLYILYSILYYFRCIKYFRYTLE